MPSAGMPRRAPSGHGRGCRLRALAWAAALALVPQIAGALPPQSARQSGQLDGVWYWDLPPTPNGLVPRISYSGAASAPDGSIYVAGMDHATNSALYGLGTAGSTAGDPAPTLAYLGDARAASEVAGNYLEGEGIEKFHTHPIWYNGRVYVANLNHSDLDAGYLNKRGFHWYAYDKAAGTFADLSASEPNGVGALHGGIVSIVLDPARGVVYGAELPTGKLYRYDIARKTTTLLGRPAYGRPYVYAGRALWLDRKGRVYFSAGNERASNGAPYDPAIFNHVHYYDPATGRFGERTGWKLHTQHAIDAAQCFESPRVCYLADNLGTVYRFLDPDPATGKLGWRRIGSIGQSTTATHGTSWVFHVDPARAFAYLMTRYGSMFVMQLSDGRIVRQLDFRSVEPGFADWQFYGHNAWDKFGRFYFAAFKPLASKSPGVRLVAIDPARFLAAAVAPKSSPLRGTAHGRP